MTSNGGRGLSGKLSKWPEEKPNVQERAKTNHKFFFHLGLNLSILWSCLAQLK